MHPFSRPPTTARRDAGSASSQPQQQQQYSQVSHAGYNFGPQYAVSSHYAQAYYQQYNQPQGYFPQTTPQGYTLSSTYMTDQGASTSFQPPTFNPTPSSLRWPGYQPGNVRCSKPGCTFTGSQKTVETHMMDRHLIFPPGWDKRKKKQDWDADPSLKGKVIPIQGTSLTLDTPEAIDAWIAERKRRFPTADRVEDKQNKLEEAAARGQLPLQVGGRFPNKRRRLEEPGRGFDGRGRGRGRGGRGKGLGRGGGHWPNTQDRSSAGELSAGPSASMRGGALSTSARPTGLPKKPDFTPTAFRTDVTEKGVEMGTLPSFPGPAGDSDGDVSESGSDSAPEAVSSKVRAGSPADLADTATDAGSGENANARHGAEENVHPHVRSVRKPPVRQPKRPPHNPFAARPLLLRNLLLPEIRMTVSNLSQAIRFLVDNDFLENVELRAGQADEKMIEVVGESEQGVDAQKEGAKGSATL